MHQGEPSGRGVPQPLPGELEGVLVTVDAEDASLGAALQHGLGVTAQPEGRVDEDSARPVECGRHESHDPVEEDRDVGGIGHRRPSVADPDHQRQEHRDHR